MKLPHVVILSIIGMLTTSLSVLVFTSPQQVSQDALTSNQLDSMVAPTASSLPRLTLKVEPEATVSSPLPTTTPKTPTADHTANAKHEATGSLFLFAVEKPCAFVLDGKPVVQGNEPLFVPLGPHKVRCERQSGDTIEREIDVSEETINTELF
jgi:hypothetical protein